MFSIRAVFIILVNICKNVIQHSCQTIGFFAKLKVNKTLFKTIFDSFLNFKQ
jgi:hypothetical protein